MSSATVSGSSFSSLVLVDPLSSKVLSKVWPVLWVAAALLFTSCGLLSKTTTPEAEQAISEQSVLALKADIYDAMARMSRAQADGDTEETEAALEEAMAGLRHLYQAPGGLQDAEGRELYRSVVTAYEQYYGVSDTMTLEYGDIFSYRDEMFAEMNQVREPLLEAVRLPEPGPVLTAIPLQRNHLVEQSIAFLQRSPEKHLYRWISRSAIYFPMFEQILREEGVPDELKYLSMIESALIPKANSHAGAAGLWQFMPATGREYGLHRTHWIDERLDPEKSTRAAAKYLKKLHRQFDDWYLALAAYNSGPGRVARAIRRHGSGSTFWDIYDDLPRETRNYVPMFIATTMMLTNPQAFNLPRVEPGPRYGYDVAQVEGMLDLRTVADLVGADVETIRALNPEIRQWTTPPTRTSYNLRVPLGRGQQFAQAYASLPPDQKRGQSEYTVRRGDSLGKIARRFGTTVAALQEVNGIRGSLIQTGQLLYVPVRYEGYTGVVNASSSGRVEYDSQPPIRYVSDTPTPRESYAAPVSNTSSTRVRYRVRRGDNLSTIARKYGVTVNDLQVWNDLSGDRIRSGQTLTVYPGRGGTTAARSSGTQRVTYKVRRGDNLSKIARKYGVRIADLRAWNDLSSDRIRSGQRLTIYTGGVRASSGGSKRWVSYSVKKGDNLTKIAKRIGVTANDIRKWNSLRNDRLSVGQRLALYTARL